MSGKFEAKVAIVTRGGSGIGAAIAERLASEGARVMLAGRTLDRLEAQAASIRAAGGVAGCQATDVSDRVQVERLIDATIEAFGGLDILVNNAGTGALGRITRRAGAMGRGDGNGRGFGILCLPRRYSPPRQTARQYCQRGINLRHGRRPRHEHLQCGEGCGHQFHPRTRGGSRH